MDDPEHLSVVVFAVRFLVDLHRVAGTIGVGEIEKSVEVASALYPGVNSQWLRRDVALVLETSGAALFDPRNTGRHDDIIRGVLR